MASCGDSSLTPAQAPVPHSAPVPARAGSRARRGRARRARWLTPPPHIVLGSTRRWNAQNGCSFLKSKGT
jgi:hypothetical protein